jgi:hypothetical protein
MPSHCPRYKKKLFFVVMDPLLHLHWLAKVCRVSLEKPWYYFDTYKDDRQYDVDDSATIHWPDVSYARLQMGKHTLRACCSHHAAYSICISFTSFPGLIRSHFFVKGVLHLWAHYPQDEQILPRCYRVTTIDCFPASLLLPQGTQYQCLLSSVFHSIWARVHDMWVGMNISFSIAPTLSTHHAPHRCFPSLLCLT